MCVYIHITVEARRGASDPSELELLVFVSWDPSSGPQNKQQVLLTDNPSLHTNTPCLDHSVSTLYKRILWRGTIRIASLSWDWQYVKLNHLFVTLLYETKFFIELEPTCVYLFSMRIYKQLPPRLALFV